MEFNEKLHRRIRRPAVLHILLPLLAAFTALMVVGRLISGVHWLSDIIGSILLSAGLVLLYAGCQTRLTARKKQSMRFLHTLLWFLLNDFPVNYPCRTLRSWARRVA